VVAYAVESGQSKVFGVQDSYRATLAGGLPATVEKTLRRDGAVSAKGTMRLAERTERDADRMRRFAAETEAYFAALRRYRETCDRTHLDTMLEQATIDAIVADLRARLGEHDELAAFERKRREGQGKIVGRPSPDWTTEDFAGKKHALADYRGKVVVLDFWFRRCGWCVRSMPDVKDIAARYGDRVAVLGMNVDRRDEDARFVIDALELSYPNLKARDLRDLYAVMGYPTVVVIDAKGVVRRIHHGSWPALRTELAALIDGLLAGSE
jgi:thiol-disulfide isomerase/thioredoxin